MPKDFDKIARDTIGSFVISLAEDFLSVKASKIDRLPQIEFLQLERVLDSVWKVMEKSGDEWILHLEFQTQDHPEMEYRMREYHTVLLSRHKLPVRQVVIYLGKKPSRMIKVVPENTVYRGYDIIELKDIPFQKLLDFKKPEAGIMAILADKGEASSEEFIQEVIQFIIKYSGDGHKVHKHLHDLQIMSRLRKLEGDILKTIKTMPFTIDIEGSPLYKEGFEEGRRRAEEATSKAINNLYKLKKLSLEELSLLYTIPIAKIRDILNLAA